MLVKFLKRDANRSVPTLLSLGLALAMSAVACGEDATPVGPSDTKEPTGKDNADDDGTEDDVAPASTKVDAGKKPATSASKDAGAPAKTNDVPAKATDDAGTAPANGGGSVDTPWCKTKAIVDKYCVSCHDAAGTGGAPMPLLSYEDMVADAPVTKGKKVYEVVGTRTHDTTKPMPPKQKLTAAELKIVDDFVAAKAPKGDNPTCGGDGKSGEGDPTVKPVTPEEWPPKECDATYKLLSHGPGGLTDPVQVAAGTETHPQVNIDAPWGDEKVQFIATRPITGNPKIVHHWILYGPSGEFLTSWGPGDDDVVALPADIGMNMPTGKSALRLDMHYFNLEGTKTETDQSGVELCIVKGEHLRKNAAAVTMSFTSFGNAFVMAPAGAKMAPITGTCNVTTTAPVHLMTAGPHAHKYARHMKFVVTKKDKTEIVMHDAPFQFGEEGTYQLQPEVILETGDVVTTTCSYTNDTNKNITFGESTTNEMCFNFASYWPAGALSCGGARGGLLGGAP